MDKFVSSKEGSMLELAAHLPLKAMDPFLQIKKKMDPVLNLEVGIQVTNALAIIEAGAPKPIQKKPPERERERSDVQASSRRQRRIEGEG